MIDQLMPPAGCPESAILVCGPDVFKQEVMEVLKEMGEDRNVYLFN